ncbi:NAD-dependent deacetylase hst3 [Vanrija albida]|uniref:NAD-dependent deacetylase hst3 n=1 Tax=Vanrija albida TaxID=181172 RepID=A0ABR3Q9Y2_9TREE
MITTLPLGQLLSGVAEADFPKRRLLSDVNIKIAKAKKVVVVSGAGISCNSGIPDFRSADGLYAMVKEKYPDAFVSGKELFSSGLFNNPATTSIFYTFIAELSLACQAAQPTRTHHFIHRLETKGKLLRSYTQNVDGFERRMGIESGGRGNGLKKNGTRNVELHGDLGRVRCVLCFADYEAERQYVDMFREGEAPHCPACQQRCEERVNRSARATSVGTLRPSIVLYDEPHPLGDEIGALQAHDMRRGPDVLLIMGTSLKVHGLKRLVKDFAKTVHEKKGVVVFVNATAPSKEWDGVIDYHVEGDTDSWVERVEEEWKKVRPQDWEIQTVLDGEVVHKSVAKTKAKPKTKYIPEVVLEPYQLPTPPASQECPSSPTSESTFVSALSSPGPSGPPTPRRTSPRSMSSSSPLSSAPPTPKSSAQRTPATAPPTPVSPSKRQNAATSVKVTKKKTRIEPPPSPTGVSAAPGRGNLFDATASVNNASDPDVFGAMEPPAVKPRVRAKAVPKAGAVAATKARTFARSRSAAEATFTLSSGMFGAASASAELADKENAQPMQPGLSRPRAARRTRSLRA